MAYSISVTGAGIAGSMFPVVIVNQPVPVQAEKRGDLEQAKNSEPDSEAMLLRAWQMAEERFGPDDLAVGSALANLADYYQSRGQITEADECDRRIRAILNQFLASVA